MKPDKKTCLNCGKEIDGKKVYCDDACRMAFKRQPEQISNPNTNKPEHLEPEQANPNKDDFRDELTKTDKTFYDRALRDFGEPFYNFTDRVHEETCILLSCRAKFKTSLAMLKYCSYEHYSDSLAGRK